jgi:hypothetical protein
MEDELMKQMITAATLALGIAASAAAQDTTVKSKTKVEADDARAVTLTGCLQQTPANVFTLRGSAVTSDEVTTRSRAKTDVDDDGERVTTSTRTRVDRDDSREVGTAGLTTIYELTPQAGINLSGHVGHQVQITAITLTGKKGGDAEVTVTERTRVQREDAEDGKAETRTKADIPRGAGNRFTVLSVKSLGTPCS